MSKYEWNQLWKVSLGCELIYKWIYDAGENEINSFNKNNPFFSDLINPYSVTAQALRYLRPLSFDF